MVNGRTQSKYWCFTLNNYTEDEETCVRSLLVDGGDVVYVCYGRETGEGGTPHLQGYMEFSRRKRLRTVKNLAGLGRAHLEKRRGTGAQAITYCKKDGDFEEFGTPTTSGQGHRSDLVEIKRKIDEGYSEGKIAEEHFGDWCRYHKAFSRYRNIKQAKTIRDLKVYVLWGAAGTGKTRYCFERNIEDTWICNDPTLQWFDGYAGESTVIIDDYRGKGNDAFLLRLLDIYPMKVPVKGGFVPWLPNVIYITSNICPPFGHEEVREPLMRRIHGTFHLGQVLDFDNESAISQVHGHFPL